ncbi:MAG: hypothetical protein V1747_05580 [Candidatus Omnitrophota bacterium]
MKKPLCVLVLSVIHLSISAIIIISLLVNWEKLNNQIGMGNVEIFIVSWSIMALILAVSGFGLFFKKKIGYFLAIFIYMFLFFENTITLILNIKKFISMQHIYLALINIVRPVFFFMILFYLFKKTIEEYYGIDSKKRFPTVVAISILVIVLQCVIRGLLK